MDVSLLAMARKPWKRHKSPGYDEAADPSIDDKFAQVRAELMPNGPGTSFMSTSAVVVDVRRDEDFALFIFSWPDELIPLALRINLEDTSEEFYYEGPVHSFDEWVEDLAAYVMVSIDTGLAQRAKRIDRGEYIELIGT
ncbi:hypothetical protein [Aeromicrobium sp. CF3.5]|uniref:hypothetical protein n=1 Tax=Aeromicrobium sp. CF3.5 TaxID=3373078 RepID=UPI003EE672FC